MLAQLMSQSEPRSRSENTAVASMARPHGVLFLASGEVGISVRILQCCRPHHPPNAFHALLLLTSSVMLAFIQKIYWHQLATFKILVVCDWLARAPRPMSMLQKGAFFLPNVNSYKLSLTHHLVSHFWQPHRGFCLVGI